MEVIKAIDFKACVPVEVTQSVIKMMPDAIVIGRCGDCKSWSDIGEYNSDPTICCSEKCSVGIAAHDFGCVMWEAKEEG